MEDRPAGALTKGTPQPPESATVPFAEENLDKTVLVCRDLGGNFSGCLRRLYRRIRYYNTSRKLDRYLLPEALSIAEPWGFASIT